MTFEEFNNIFRTPFLNPWENDYYSAFFENAKTSQEFLDYSYTTITGLRGLWYEVVGNMAYFIVPKGTTVPEDFADLLHIVTDVPEQPTEEGTE